MTFTLFTDYKALTDEQLMERVRLHTSEKAFEEIYHRYARLLQGFFFRRLGGNEEQALDLTQDTFLRMWGAREQYALNVNVRTWVFTIAYNLCKNIYRQNMHEQEYLDSLPAEEPLAEDNTPIILDAATFDKALQQELLGMSEQQQMLFELRFTQELTVPEIARILSIPQGTVKSRLHTLTEYLRKKLKNYE